MMTRDEFQALMIGLVAGGLGVVLLLTISFGAKPEYHWRHEIIKHGAGQYNKTTGAFEWVEVHPKSECWRHRDTWISIENTQPWVQGTFHTLCEADSGRFVTWGEPDSVRVSP